MSQWVAEVLAQKVGEDRVSSLLGSATAEAVSIAAAIWQGESPAEPGPAQVVAARAWLSRLVDGTPGLKEFLTAGRRLGELHAEFALAERLGVPKLVLMHLQNEIQAAHVEFEKSKPGNLPLGFENRSWASVLGLLAELEELAALEISEDRSSRRVET